MRAVQIRTVQRKEVGLLGRWALSTILVIRLQMRVGLQKHAVSVF